MSKSSRKKVLLLSEIFPPTHGGSGRWFSEIYRRFPEGDVAFLVGAHEQAEAHDAELLHPIYRADLSSREWGLISKTGLGFYLRVWRHLRKIVKKESITQLHCGRVLPEGVAALLLKVTNRIPYYCYVHGEDVETALASRELTWLVRLVMNNADRIICNSENSRRILHEKWQVSDEKVLVMNPGVDVDRFVPDAGATRPENWGNGPVLLTVGRLQKRKGQDMMIRALPALKEQWPEIRYAIVGGGTELDSLKRLASEQGVSDHVLFMGEIEDWQMVNAYRHCTLFALPNRRIGNDDEGFGMVLLEAQACGRPVLAGASGGTRETMLVGETGVVVDCTYPESIVSAVSELLADSQKLSAMGRNGRAHVVERFSWNNLAGAARRAFFNESNSDARGNIIRTRQRG